MTARARAIPSRRAYRAQAGVIAMPVSACNEVSAKEFSYETQYSESYWLFGPYIVNRPLLLNISIASL